MSDRRHCSSGIDRASADAASPCGARTASGPCNPCMNRHEEGGDRPLCASSPLSKVTRRIGGNIEHHHKTSIHIYGRVDHERTRTHHHRVFVINPQELVRVGMRTLLNSVPDFRIVGAAPSRGGHCRWCFSTNQTLSSSISAYRTEPASKPPRILSHLPATRLLFLADTLNDTILLSAVATGAHGYVRQDAGAGNPDARCAWHHQGTGLSSIRASPATPLPISAKWRIVNLSGAAICCLHGKDASLLLIAQGKTNKEIAAELGLSDKTVKNYLANVYSNSISPGGLKPPFYLKTIP